MAQTNSNFAVLFDVDGVVLDTEPQYDLFWNEQGKIFHPELPNFAHFLKGFSLERTIQTYFNDNDENRETVVKRLNEFEDNMKFEYLPGALSLFEELKANGIKMALVTSSNDLKMEKIIRAHPEFNKFFSAIVTSNKVTKTKPEPDCYIEGARLLNFGNKDCFVIEDSKAGIEAGKSAGSIVIGLTTTQTKEEVEKNDGIFIVNNLADVSFMYLAKLKSSCIQ